MTAPRWHYTGHVSIATHNGAALVESYNADWPQGLRGPRVDTYTVVIVRGRGRFEVRAGTRREARALAVEVAETLKPPAPPRPAVARRSRS